MADIAHGSDNRTGSWCRDRFKNETGAGAGWSVQRTVECPVRILVGDKIVFSVITGGIKSNGVIGSNCL